jgi:hypothetical protein
MKVKFIILIFVTLIAACSNGDGRESFGDKAEWSILQGIEFDYRNKQIDMPRQITAHGYEILGVKHLDGKGYIWIMLWPKSAPFYKQIPDGNYMLQKSLLDNLVKNNKVSSTVEGALRSHVSE